MPIWLAPILSFVGQRFIHFAIYAAIGLTVWGIYQKVFVTPTNSIGTIERQVNVYDKPSVPIFGCNAWRVHASVYWEKANHNGKKEVKNAN